MTREEIIDGLILMSKDYPVDSKELFVLQETVTLLEGDGIMGKINSMTVQAKNPVIKAISGTTGEITIGGFFEI